MVGTYPYGDIHISNEYYSTYQFLEPENGKREGSISTIQTAESLSTGEKKIWRTIRKELGNIGLTGAAFDANKEVIMDLFKGAIATGAITTGTLEEQAPEDASSSRSRG